MNYRRIWDPLYGRINLSRFESELISLPEVQRLRYIRMCNINSLLITGASEISRFEHTIGVLRLAQEWIQENNFHQTGGENLLAAAILHDVQTGPFGHSFQYVLEDTSFEDKHFVHDDLVLGAAENYYMQIPAAAHFAGVGFGAQQLLKDRWKDVATIIGGSGRLGPLIAGTMDLDNLDNVVRLAYHAGLADQEDVDTVLRITRGIRPGKRPEILSVRSGVVEDITRWQGVRKRLYEFLLLDWAEFSAKAMLTRAVEEALKNGVLGSNSWAYTDDGFLEHLEEEALGEKQEIADLVRRIRCGDLYSPILMERSTEIQHYKRLSSPEVKADLVHRIESDILRRCGMSTKAIFHVILDAGKTERAIPVEIDDGPTMEIGQNSRSLLVGIFLSRPWSQGSRQLAEAQNGLGNLLYEAGLGATQPLSDPMGPNPSDIDAQLSLL